jgi:CHAT domain-containing protein/tetratricopeptide (TPR) repeat protein
MRSLVLVVLCLPSLLFAAAPPLGPERPLTAQERQEVQRAMERVFAQWQEAERLGQRQEALAKGKEVLAFQERLHGPWHERVERWCSGLAARLSALGEYEQAVLYREKALVVRLKLSGQGDWRVLDSRLDLEEARQQAKRDEATRQQLLRAERLNGQVFRLWQQGRSKEALPLAEEALAIRRKVLGDRHRLTALSLLNLGAQHAALHQVRQAEDCSRRALALDKEVLGEKHPDYATSLNNLASLYKQMGEYARARPLYEQALALRKELLGEKHPLYADSLNNLAEFYKELAEYTRARSLFEQALALRKEVQGEKYPHYATFLRNLAGLYLVMGESTRARPLYEQALALRKELLGEKHPEYAESLNDLAVLYSVMEEYGRARTLLEQTLALFKEVVGEKHPESIRVLCNLARVNQKMGEYGRARPLLEQALALNKEVLGEKHPLYALNLSWLALLDWEERRPAEASKQLGAALRSAHQHLDTTFSALSGRQRLQLLAQTRYFLNAYLSVSAEAKLPAGEVHQAVLAWKGIAGARAAEEQILRDHPALAPLLEELRRKRAGLAHLSAHPPTPANREAWSGRSRELDRQREDLELQLAQKSAAFRFLRSPQSKEVAAALPERSALVDLLEYEHRTPAPRRPGKWPFERRLVAFVLAKGQETVRVDLGAVEPISEAVLAWRRPMQTLSAVDEKAAAQLRSQLWDKLAPSLAGCDTVLISPDGVLCSLPWAALPGTEPGAFLIEEVAIAQIPSAQQLRPLANRADSGGLLAVGGLDYGKPTVPGKGWVALPGTTLEARGVVKLHQERFPKGRAARLLEGAAVDKAALAAALSPGKGEPSWRQIHLATHGYFLQPSAQKALAVAARGGAEVAGLAGEEPVAVNLDPLLGCGLVLSGANQDSGRGTLTALEVADLDLRGCEVLVLSACETGLGKLEGGEGVLGLQSAFHGAGARTVVASLWSVSDPATSVLMEHFYRNLWADKPMTRLEALRQAQLFVLKHPEAVRQRARELREALVKGGRGTAEEVRGKGKEVELSEPRPPGSGLSHPAWWAAIVLSGDPGTVQP